MFSGLCFRCSEQVFVMFPGHTDYSGKLIWVRNHFQTFESKGRLSPVKVVPGDHWVSARVAEHEIFTSGSETG